MSHENPTFVGIGAPRCGTTWLHELLATHPHIYVPTRRKELHFYDRNWDRGRDWYASFFPAAAAAARYRAIGEFTPEYLYCPEVPSRLAEVGVEKLILMVREPADRTYSVYTMMTRDGTYTGTFDEFLREHTVIADQSGYVNYVRHYSAWIERGNLLALVYENAVRDVDATKLALAQFLGVDASRFPASAGRARANPSYVPRARRAYAMALRTAHYLRRRWDNDWVINTAKRLGIERLFGNAGRLPSLPPNDRARLATRYRADNTALAELIDLDLSVWSD